MPGDTLPAFECCGSGDSHNRRTRLRPLQVRGVVCQEGRFSAMDIACVTLEHTGSTYSVVKLCGRNIGAYPSPQSFTGRKVTADVERYTEIADSRQWPVSNPNTAPKRKHEGQWVDITRSKPARLAPQREDLRRCTGEAESGIPIGWGRVGLPPQYSMLSNSTSIPAHT